MRKPVVVVCAAASALLLAGGVVATSASADERPDAAGWGSFWWPGLFGGDEPVHQDDVVGEPVHQDEEPFADRGPAERPTLDDDAPRSEDPVERPDPVRPPARDRSAPERPAAAQQPAERPLVKAERPAPARQRVAQRPASGQRPAADVMVGARQAVTAADVSASPSAPVQQRVLTLINHNRRRGGCDPFTLDRRLIEAANEHAADMARRDYFAHESPNGEGAGERVSDAGYRWKRYGENIARGADSAWEVVDGWMNSPSHRENILDCRLHEMGVGLAISRDRTPYWVQDFATPQS